MPNPLRNRLVRLEAWHQAQEAARYAAMPTAELERLVGPEANRYLDHLTDAELAAMAQGDVGTLQRLRQAEQEWMWRGEEEAGA